MNCSRYNGKVALITGGGTGIGAATAQRIAAEGGKVVVTGRRFELIKKIADEVGGAAIAGDVTDLAHLKAAVALAVERFGGLDVLVANAGVETFGSVEQISLEDWQRTLEVNLDGAMRACRIAIPAMRARGGGSIIHVASVAALSGAPAYVSYLTSKAALLGLNRSIAYDYGPEGIRSNAICPGWVHTEMTERAIGDIAKIKHSNFEDLMAEVVRPYPLRRMARPGEIAAVIAFLGSDDASFMTGSVVTADGGGSIVDIGTLAFPM